jgi:hypothetical protein
VKVRAYRHTCSSTWTLNSNDMMTCFCRSKVGHAPPAQVRCQVAMICFRWGRVRGTWKRVMFWKQPYVFPAPCMVCLPHIWVMLILNFWHAGTDVPSYIEWSRSNGTLLNEIVDGIWSFNGCHQSHNIAAQTKGKNDGFWKPPVKALCKPKGLYIWMLEIATPKQTPNMW